MNTAIVNAKIDPQVKKKAQKIAAEIGVSLSDVIDASLREFIHKKSITFRVNEELSDYAIQSLRESMEDIKAGRVSPAFTKTKDAIKWLNNPKRKYANQLQSKVR